MDTKKLRQKILDLAIRGKLVPQDPNDEPASVLLERIRAEKEQLIKEGKIKRSKKSAATDKSHYENVPFEIPENWVWTTLGEISNYGQCENVDVDKIAANEWILELEDIEKDSGRIIQKLCKDDRKACGTRHKFYRNEILYSKLRTYLNKVLVAPSSGFCTSEIIPIHCIETNPWFICFVLRSNYFLDYTASLGYGVKMPRLGTNDALISYIPLPPLSEQARIVDEVAKWNIIIDEIEDDKLELEAYVKKTKSKILDLAISGKLVPQDPNDEPAIELLKRINPGFEPCDNSHYENLPENWCLAKVKDVFVINPRNKAEDNTIAGFIPMTLIDDGYSNTFSYEKREWGSIKTGFTHFADGDVAVAKISPCLENRKSIVLRDLPNGIGAGTTELHVFRSSVVVPEYALYFFKSEYFISKCVGTFNGVVGQQRVGKNIIEETQIPIPPINEQTKIVSTIETIFTQLNTITAEL